MINMKRYNSNQWYQNMDIQISSSSASLTISVAQLLQLSPLQSPQAETQLNPFARQEQAVELQGLLDVNLQLHLMIFRSSGGATS